MNPERVLEEQTERNQLRAAVLRFAVAVQKADTRQSTLSNAEVVVPGINCADDAVSFADNLTAKLVGRPVSDKDGDTHPLLRLLDFFLQNGLDAYGFHPGDEDLFKQLLEQGHDRAAAVRARRAVVKLENERKQYIGTGVLVGKALLLTCEHVLSKSRVRHAWACFGHKVNWDGKSIAAGERIELNVKEPLANGGGSQPDYAILRLKATPRQPAPLAPVKAALNSGQAVRTIHHPGGKPAAVSKRGTIAEVGEDYIYHDLATEDGSSGAPIFDDHWQMVALHQGTTITTPPGLSAGVPLYAFWDAITAHILT